MQKHLKMTGKLKQMYKFQMSKDSTMCPKFRLLEKGLKASQASAFLLPE